jgi:hypothetical protein
MISSPLKNLYDFAVDGPVAAMPLVFVLNEVRVAAMVSLQIG